MELLVVDDVDGGIPALEIDPSKLKKALDMHLGEKFLPLMKERRTLWVAGTNDRAEMWQQLIAKLVADGDVTRVGKVALSDDLQSKLRTGPRFRRGRPRADQSAQSSCRAGFASNAA